MNRIDEILSNIDLNNENHLTVAEKKRIMSLINEKLNNSKPHRRRKPIKILLIAAAIIIITAGAVLAVREYYIDKNLSEQLGITENNQEQFENAVDTPICSMSDKGISINVLQTLSDKRTLFTIFTVTTKDDMIFSDEYFFYNAKVLPENPEKYSPFGYKVVLLDEIGRTKKYLAYITATAIDLESGKLNLHLGDLCKYIKDENGNKVKDNNGIEVTETVISGNWDLEWEYNNDIKSDVKEMAPNIEIPLSSSVNGQKTITVNKIILSPLSISVDFTFDGSYIDDNIGGALISVDFKDGTNITSMDIPTNAQHSFDGTMGHIYYRFDKIIDINEIKSISIDDEIISVN